MWFAIVALLSISPRLVYFILWLVTDYTDRAFDGWFWPFMGFLLMPWTTLWCAYVYNNGDFGTWRYVVLIFCILVDLSCDEQVGEKTAEQV